MKDDGGRVPSIPLGVDTRWCDRRDLDILPPAEYAAGMARGLVFSGVYPMIYIATMPGVHAKVTIKHEFLEDFDRAKGQLQEDRFHSTSHEFFISRLTK